MEAVGIASGTATVEAMIDELDDLQRNAWDSIIDAITSDGFITKQKLLLWISAQRLPQTKLSIVQYFTSLYIAVGKELFRSCPITELIQDGLALLQFKCILEVSLLKLGSRQR